VEESHLIDSLSLQFQEEMTYYKHRKGMIHSVCSYLKTQFVPSKLLEPRERYVIEERFPMEDGISPVN